MSSAAARKARPKYLSLRALLLEIRLPRPGWVSILHRISGALLVFPFAAWLLWLLDASLASQAGFDRIAGYMSLARLATTTLGGHATDNLQAIAAVVLGGTSLFGGVGTVLGTVVGVFIPAVLQNGFVITGVEPFWRDVAVGAVLIAAVYLDQLRRRTQYRD